MARTTPGRENLDVGTVGQSVITKLLQGFGISLSATGADAGTGDVTATVNIADLDTLYPRTPSVSFVMSGSPGMEPVADDKGDYVTVA